MRNEHKYTKEDVDFIRKNIDTMSFKQMAAEFTSKYDMAFKACSIQKVAHRNNIKKTLRVYKNGKDRKMSFDKISEEKESFIKDKFDDCKTYQELAEEYEKHFGVEVSSRSMNVLCREKYGLSHENIGKFKKDGRNRKLDIGTERIGSGYKNALKH